MLAVRPAGSVATPGTRRLVSGRQSLAIYIETKVGILAQERTVEIDRRQFAVGALGGVAALAVALAAGPAAAQDATQPPLWQQAVDKILKGAKPVQGKLVLDMPEIAENGNTVPFTLSADSPMTDTDYVKAMHVVSTGNPQPGVATFKFTPASGKAFVSSRMRLGRTQDVILIAELSDGRFLMTRRNVKVTIGGCGG
ncbi:MAG: thiosulfate oxidation carrier protein SoxY [Hyphomicrobiaceae bacterium]|nr:thiosulfate oxidation carrier protein SoxY [Hyphomicrobiaceae bacterium]